MKSKPATLLNIDLALRDAAWDKGWEAVEAVGDVLAEEWTDAMNEAFETAYNAFMDKARKQMEGAGE